MPFQIFDGVYETLNEAGGSLDVFRSKEYLDKAERRLLAAIEGLTPINEYIFTPLVASLLLDRGEVSVLDFGGGPGITYLALKKTLTSTQGLTYHVIDDKEICALGRAHLGNEASHIFREQVSELDARYDFVHLGSVLQYVDDPGSLLSLIQGKKPQYILISDAMTGTGRTFVTQADWYGQKHPHRFFRESDLLTLLKGIGYELAMKVPFVPKIQGQSEFYDMKNLPPDCRTDNTCHLLFKAST